MASFAPLFLAATFAAGPAGAAFYTPPSPLPPAAHGDVIWARPITTAAALPSAAANTLVLYHTVGADGRDRAVSGTVAMPKGTPPAGGWPVISWAHGTTGDAPQCAPSLVPADAGANAYLAPIAAVLDGAVARGFAVVQTDYEGQGTPGTQPYLVGVAEAHDVIDMVRAARAVAPSLGTRWVAMGHSQGGHATLFASALAPAWAPELRLTGAVAEAPPAYVSAFIASLPKMAAPSPAFAFGALFLEGAAAADPSIRLDDILTPPALALRPHLRDRCSHALARPDSWGGIVPASAFRPNADLQPLLRFAASSDAATLKPAVPLFIVQGSADTTVPQPSSDALDKALCASGVNVRYDVYRGLSHREVVPASATEALDWAGARIVGTPATPNCASAPALRGA
jgi:predicted esterase